VKAIVTGGAGFIGSHLVERLIADGVAVHVIDDFRSGDTLHTRATTHGVSIRNVAWDVWSGADAIYHLASPVGPVGVLRQAGHIAADVINDAATVAAAARLNGCPLVYVSTSELYGPQGGACDETLNRVTVPGHSARMEYAVAKLAAETALLNSGIDVRIVRPFNVAGPRQKPDGGFVLPRFIDQAKAGVPLTVYAPGTQLRAFTHVLDIVDGLLAVAHRGLSGEVFNLGNADNLTTIEALARLVLDVVNPAGSYELVDPVTLWGPDFREAADKYPDATHAKVALGWRAFRSLRKVVEDAAA
jgi:nucleoside-diphosphate-sugar epimerase